MIQAQKVKTLLTKHHQDNFCQAQVIFALKKHTLPSCLPHLEQSIIYLIENHA
jgi:hypothetical protein